MEASTGVSDKAVPYEIMGVVASQALARRQTSWSLRNGALIHSRCAHISGASTSGMPLVPDLHFLLPYVSFGSCSVPDDIQAPQLQRWFSSALCRHCQCRPRSRFLASLHWWCFRSIPCWTCWGKCEFFSTCPPNGKYEKKGKTILSVSAQSVYGHKCLCWLYFYLSLCVFARSKLPSKTVFVYSCIYGFLHVDITACSRTWSFFGGIHDQAG
jgi:hypothetical protein